MDNARLDQLARWVGARNRRQVVGAALSGAIVALGGSVVTDANAKPKVKAEGPCGNGSIKDNRCRRNRQCCTGLCDKKKGKKPYGRCRCRKPNQSCQEDRNCCATAGQPMSCVAGTCQSSGACVSLGGACTAGGSACCTEPGADATCTAGICRAPQYCETTLEAAGCEFLASPGIWNCGSQDLTSVNLSGCDLAGASFFTTNLTNAILVSTDLTDANFFGSNVTDVEWGNTTCPQGVNSDANGDTCCGEFINDQVPEGCAAG